MDGPTSPLTARRPSEDVEAADSNPSDPAGGVEAAGFKLEDMYDAIPEQYVITTISEVSEDNQDYGQVELRGGGHVGSSGGADFRFSSLPEDKKKRRNSSGITGGHLGSGDDHLIHPSR